MIEDSKRSRREGKGEREKLELFVFKFLGAPRVTVYAKLQSFTCGSHRYRVFSNTVGSRFRWLNNFFEEKVVKQLQK